jgi:predicted amidohydrolase
MRMSHCLPQSPLRVAVVQNAAGPDADVNRAWLADHLPLPGTTDLIALPEVFSLRGSDADYRASAEPLDGPTARWLAELARARRAWLLAGSILEQDGPAIYNTCMLFDPAGTRVAAYRKIHLFEATLEDGRVIRESDLYAAGSNPVEADLNGWHCGFSICYDVRFPELYRHYSKHGAHLLFVPSNFTQRTGRDHWNVLVRSRAIENQCFVVAPNQCGQNRATRVASHGHSLIVSPWGEVLAQAGNRPAVIEATLDPSLLHTTRARVPALAHRRLG